MTKLILTILTVFLLFLLGCGDGKETLDSPKQVPLTLPDDLPELGSKVKYDGVNWTVVARGATPFECTSSGESLGLYDYKSKKIVVVIAEEKGVVIKINPTVPTVMIKNEERFPNIKMICQPGAYCLMEYDRASN